MNRLLSLSMIIAATGCSTGPKTAEVKPDERAVLTPLRVHWSPARDDGGHLALTAMVELRAKLHQKVSVRLDLPAGLKLVTGLPSFEIPAEAEAGEVSVPYEFAYTGAAPAGDLKLVADFAGAGTGVHATDSYRFGRPPPSPARPTAEGPGLRYGNKDLGPAVPLDKH